MVVARSLPPRLVRSRVPALSSRPCPFSCAFVPYRPFVDRPARPACHTFRQYAAAASARVFLIYHVLPPTTTRMPYYAARMLLPPPPVFLNLPRPSFFTSSICRYAILGQVLGTIILFLPPVSLPSLVPVASPPHLPGRRLGPLLPSPPPSAPCASRHCPYAARARGGPRSFLRSSIRASLRRPARRSA